MLTKEEYSRLHTQLCLRCLAFNQVTEIIERFVEKPSRKIQVGDIYLNNVGAICEIEKFCDIDNKNIIQQQEVMIRNGGNYLASGLPDKYHYYHLILDKRYKLVEITDGE